MKRHAAWLVLALWAAVPSRADQAPLYVHEDIVVSASRFAEPFPERPLDVTVINRDEIERSTARSLPELLGRRAGFAVRDLFGNGSAGATLDLRGFGASAEQNLLVLLDGRPLNDPDLSGVQWATLPLAEVERVELLRGGSVQWGAGAVAGVVNIITRKPRPGAAHGALSLAAGSWDSVEGRASASVGGERAALRVNAGGLRGDGWRENNRNETETASAELSWQGEGTRLAVRAALDRQDLRLPGPRTVQPSAGVDELSSDPRGSGTPLDWSSRDGNHLAADLEARTAIGELALGLGWRDKTQVSYFDFGGFPDYREAGLDLLSLTPRLKLRHSLFGTEHALVAGVDLYWWDYDLDTSNAPDNIARPINRVHAEQRNLGLWLQDSVLLAPATRLTLGARSERQEIEGRDHYDPGAPGAGFGSAAPAADEDYSEPSWEVALSHALRPGLALRGRIGRAVRFANVDEIYEFSPTFTREFQLLRPQTSVGGDLTVDWQGGGYALRATVFRIDTEDEIHLDPYSTGIGNTNLPPARRQGLELEAKLEPRRGLWLAAAYGYVDARFREGVLPGGPFTAVNVDIAGRRVPLVPRHRASAEATLALTPQTLLGASVVWFDRQFMDNDEGNTLGTRIPSYAVADLRLTHRVDALSLSAAVHNLFDRDYYNYAVRSQFVADRYNAYPLPGRSFVLEAALDI